MSLQQILLEETELVPEVCATHELVVRPGHLRCSVVVPAVNNIRGLQKPRGLAPTTTTDDSYWCDAKGR